MSAPDTALEIVEVSVERRDVVLRAPSDSAEAGRIHEAAVAVTPRAWVELSRTGEGDLLVRLTLRQEAETAGDLRQALLSLANELATATTWAIWRAQLKAAHADRVRDLTLGALASVMNPSGRTP